MLDGCGRSALCFGCFAPRQENRYQFYGRLSGPQGRSGRVWKTEFFPISDTCSVRTVVNLYIDFVIRASFVNSFSYRVNLHHDSQKRVSNVQVVVRVEFIALVRPVIHIPSTCNITSQGLTDSPPDRLRILVLDVYFATIIKYNHFRNIHVAATDVPTRQERLGHP